MTLNKQPLRCRQSVSNDSMESQLEIIEFSSHVIGQSTQSIALCAKTVDPRRLSILVLATWPSLSIFSKFSTPFVSHFADPKFVTRHILDRISQFVHHNCSIQDGDGNGLLRKALAVLHRMCATFDIMTVKIYLGNNTIYHCRMSKM